jgi:hypothetical protein
MKTMFLYLVLMGVGAGMTTLGVAGYLETVQKREPLPVNASLNVLHQANAEILEQRDKNIQTLFIAGVAGMIGGALVAMVIPRHTPPTPTNK